jgi:DNA-binding NarL/FixJ family response regulator
MTSPYRILIVHEFKILRQALRQALEFCVDFEVVGDTDGSLALAKVLDRQPDALLIDLRLPTVSQGVRLLASCRALCPDLRAIALVPSNPDESLVSCALEAGVVGLVSEDTDNFALIERGVRAACAGKSVLPAAELVTPAFGGPRLSHDLVGSGSRAGHTAHQYANFWSTRVS